MRRFLVAFALAAPTVATAQNIEPAAMRRLVDTVAAIVGASYAIPDTGRMIAEHLRSQRDARAYDKPMTHSQLADRLTADLKAINGDLHLNVTWLGQRAQPAGPQMMMRRPGEAIPPELLRAARWSNFNVNRVDRLAGNVGYLSLGQLSGRGSAEIYAVIDAAMAVLERTDAMIIDLRDTPGGEPRISDYIAGYFFGPDSVRTLATTSPMTGGLAQRWTSKVNGRPRPDVPVYVLVGAGSASGAEDLAFIFKQLHRGVLVGERTAGAGRPNRIVPAGDGFMVSVSYGRTVDPRTGTEWERVGIQPDVATPVDDALEAAHLRALDSLRGLASDSSARQTLSWARDGVAARANPAPVKEAELARYVGEYEGRIIEVRGGKLAYRREANRAPVELASLGGDAFAMGEAGRVEFVRTGQQVTAMRVMGPGAPVTTVPRSKVTRRPSPRSVR